MHPGNTILEYLNNQYIRKALLFPENLNDTDTDDFLAWKVGRAPLKARSTCFSHNLIDTCNMWNVLENRCRNNLHWKLHTHTCAKFANNMWTMSCVQKPKIIICRNYYIKHICLFQLTDEDVPYMQHTLAILMGYITAKDVDDAIVDLINFTKQKENHEWLKKLTSFLCKCFDKTHAKLMWNFPLAALNVCGIIIWARCYCHQVGIIFNTGFWCTSREQDIHKCNIILIYRGSNRFEDTCAMTLEEFNTMSENVGRIQAVMDEKDPAKNVSNMVRKCTKEYRHRVDKIESDDDDSELDLEETLEQGIPVHKEKKDRKTRRTLDLQMTTRSRSHKMQKTKKTAKTNSQADNNVQKLSPECKEKSPPGYMQNCSVVITQKDLSAALDRIWAMNEALLTYKEEQKGSKEKANIVYKDTDKSKLKGKPKKPAWKPTQKSVRQAVERKLKIDKAGSILQKAKKKRKGSWGEAVNKRQQMKTLLKFYICPVTPCPEKKGSKIALLKHIATDHKKFCFKCRYCEKRYQTFIGRYKHEKYHLHGKPYGCQYCPKSFLFKGERDEHLRKHTQKNLWKCELDTCDKEYASKRAMKAHVKSHYEEEVVCEHDMGNGKECGQVCINSVHLWQH